MIRAPAMGLLAAAAALIGCGERRDPGPPTEQEIHAGDSGDGSGVQGRHPYRCNDGTRLLVDFKDQGLQLILRTSANAQPIELTAPMQGLQYVGDRITATFSGSDLIVQRGDDRPLSCVRETAR